MERLDAQRVGGDYSRALIERATEQPQYDNSEAIREWECSEFPMVRIRRLW